MIILSSINRAVLWVCCVIGGWIWQHDAFAQNTNSKVRLYSTQKEYFYQLRENGETDEPYIYLLRPFRSQFELEIAPFQRAIHYLGDTKATCVLFARKSKKRSADYIFSLPVTILIGPRLYAKEDAIKPEEKYFNSKGEMTDLPALMASKNDFYILIGRNISYGDELDEIVAKIPATKRYARVMNQSKSNFADIMMQRNIPFAIMYPATLREARKLKPSLEYKISPIVIAGVPNTVSTRIMCNKHPASRDFVDSVNARLKSLYTDTRFLNMNQSLSDPEDRDIIRSAIRNIVLSHER